MLNDEASRLKEFTGSVQMTKHFILALTAKYEQQR